jgi:hypothetical protein
VECKPSCSEDGESCKSDFDCCNEKCDEESGKCFSCVSCHSYPQYKRCSSLNPTKCED